MLPAPFEKTTTLRTIIQRACFMLSYLLQNGRNNKNVNLFGKLLDS